MYIDLNEWNSLYDSFTEPGSRASWWNDIFVQPYARTLQSEADKVSCITDYLSYCRVSGCSKENANISVHFADPPVGKFVWNSSGTWGPSKGGGLNVQKVRQTRALLNHCTQLTIPFQRFLWVTAVNIGLTGNAILAVHLRLTDKVQDEAKENATLSNEAIVGKIKCCMGKLGCMSVLFCSDDQTRKTQMKETLASENIHCITYESVLSRNVQVGLHFSSVPKNTQCRDVAVEVALMAKYCKGLLCSRSNLSFMIAVLADDNYEVFDMLSDRHVGPMRSTAWVHTSYVNAFRSETNKDVECMWLDHDICVIQIHGFKYTENLIGLLSRYIIFSSLNEFEETVNYDDAAVRLHGFKTEWSHLTVVKITKFDPARVGWGLGQNEKTRKHALALSVLIPLLLDKWGGTCTNNFVSSLCSLAAEMRPPAV